MKPKHTPPANAGKWGGRQPKTPGGPSPSQAWAAFDRRKLERAERAAAITAHRLRTFAYWRALAAIYPGGVVPVPTAARILGVSRVRIRQLIARGRLPLLRPFPGGTEGDRMIPVDALMGAPTLRDTGRPGGWNLGAEYLESHGYGVNGWRQAMRDAMADIQPPAPPKKNLMQDEA